MKKLFIILILASITNFSFSQRLKSIDTLDYKVMIDKNRNDSFKNTMDIDVYKSIDGNYFKAGDTLMLGRISGVNGNLFECVFYGKPSGVFLKGIRYVENRYENYPVIIEKLQYYKGTMGMENYVFAYVNPLPNKDFTLIDDVITITLFDTALQKGEVYPLHPTRPLTRDEAVELLKSKNIEFELGIITQEEFDAYKKELIPIIRSLDE